MNDVSGDRLLRKTGYPLLLLSIMVLFGILTIVFLISALFGHLHLAYFATNLLVFLLLYLDFVATISIYYFYADKIILRAPFSVFNRKIVINVSEIRTVTFISRLRGPDIFRIVLKNGKEHEVRYHRNMFWNNSFNFAIRYFRQLDIELLKMSDSGKITQYEYDG